MPAVNLVRLRAQIHELAWKFTRPVEFHNELTDLFEIYADRVYRPGKATRTNNLAPSYHVSPLVLRELDLGLSAYCSENPPAALTLADELWKDAYFETRQVAALLLGHVPLTPPDPVIERLERWSHAADEITATTALLEQGAVRLRREMPDRWLAKIREWADRPAPLSRSLAIRAMLPFANDPDFENLPAVFQNLRLTLQEAQPSYQGELEDLLGALIRRSQVETSSFLRQALALPVSPSAVRTVRRLIPAFSPELQKSLRAVLGRAWPLSKAEE